MDGVAAERRLRPGPALPPVRPVPREVLITLQLTATSEQHLVDLAGELVEELR